MSARQLDVLIDASDSYDDSAFRGIGTYLGQLLSGLASRSDVEVTALVRQPADTPDGIRRARLRRVAPGRWRRLEHELLLPLDLRLHEAAVFHSPAQNPPRRYGRPWVQTLHGLMPLRFDDPALRAERLRLQRQAPRYRSASAIVSVSRHTAGEGISLLGIDPGRIEVIPHGVGSEFRPRRDGTDGDQPYLLMVAEYSPRKGYPEAFAIAGALAQSGYPHTLRVAARLAPWVRPTVEQLRAAATRPERIELLGFRASGGSGADGGAWRGSFPGDLVSQYQGASLLLVTSHYESFGLPILEAMACGTPVVAFANSAIPEVAGDAAVLVANGDQDELLRAVRGVLDDPGRWRELSERGIERARSFTWERAVSDHVELYRRVAA